jgi:hypothetical protein
VAALVLFVIEIAMRLFDRQPALRGPVRGGGG